MPTPDLDRVAPPFEHLAAMSPSRPSRQEFHFDSAVKLGAKLPRATVAEIKAEPMLFKCDGNRAALMGGPLTRAFLKSLPSDWRCQPMLIDSRAHMLMPGWFPCIPGWHHDDVPRERKDGQPNYINHSYRAEHVMALWGDASLTEFALGKASFLDLPLGSVFYREWHNVVEHKILCGQLARFTAPQRRLVFFDWNAWHRGTAATKNGWRFFIRATRFSKLKPANELRTQTQIYMEDATAGW